MKSKSKYLFSLILAGVLAASFASCDKKSGKTTVEDKSAPEGTSAPAAEKDSDGSMITYIAVTGDDGKAVTNADNKPVTEAAIVDKDGKIVTDSNGKNVAPNIKERIVSDNKTSQNNAAAVTKKVDGPGPTLTIPGDLEASAGQEFSFKIAVTNNSGYTALRAFLDIEKKYFELVAIAGGDTESANNKRSSEFTDFSYNMWNGNNDEKIQKDLDCASMLYFSSANETLNGDTTYATVTLKVKDDVPAGKYDICFDSYADGLPMCTNIESLENAIVTSLMPKYVNGSVTIK